jgi:phosphoadenosine phosphosulfate reductase
MSGLRREQSPTRSNIQFVNKDQRFSSIKICPLIHWTWNEVWEYIMLHCLPYNTLHDRGYPSIGCKHCTLPVEDGNDLRVGRWAGFAKTECGLHQ